MYTLFGQSPSCWPLLGCASTTLVILRNLRLILSADFMALMFETPLTPVTLLIRLMDLVGFSKPLISSHSLHRKTHRNAPETRATKGFQPKKFFLFFFAVFCCFFQRKAAQ
jgi:hypothetical protein